MIKNTFH